MILNPYSFVPLTAHIKLEIYYPNELELKCSQELGLMALNDTFTIQEMNMDTKDISYDIKVRELEFYWNNEGEQNSTDNRCKVLSD